VELKETAFEDTDWI